jgi:hypothetical protein
MAALMEIALIVGAIILIPILCVAYIMLFTKPYSRLMEILASIYLKRARQDNQTNTKDVKERKVTGFIKIPLAVISGLVIFIVSNIVFRFFIVMPMSILTVPLGKETSSFLIVAAIVTSFILSILTAFMSARVVYDKFGLQREGYGEIEEGG